MSSRARSGSLIPGSSTTIRSPPCTAITGSATPNWSTRLRRILLGPFDGVRGLIRVKGRLIYLQDKPHAAPKIEAKLDCLMLQFDPFLWIVLRHLLPLGGRHHVEINRGVQIPQRPREKEGDESEFPALSLHAFYNPGWLTGTPASTTIEVPEKIDRQYTGMRPVVN